LSGPAFLKLYSVTGNGAGIKLTVDMCALHIGIVDGERNSHENGVDDHGNPVLLKDRFIQ